MQNTILSKSTIRRLRHIGTTILLTIALTTACTTSNFPKDTYKYSELKNIDIQFTIDKIKSVDIDHKKNVFLYFNYQIDNQSSAKVFFDPATIRMNADGLINNEIHYGSSMGSATTEQLVLPEGLSSYYLYAVYDNTAVKNGVKSISIEHPGVTVEAFEN